MIASHILPRILALSVLTLTGFLLGCERSPEPAFRFNEVEWLKQEKLELPEGEQFPAEYRRQIGNILTALFGTPDEPRVPSLLPEDDPAEELLDLEKLQLAAGAVASDREGRPAGLYREHCAHCHGITGDGAGPTAAFLNPYPRDFRLGKFKFKSTPLRTPPTHEDLVEILRNGIPGTAMPSFRTLPDEEIDALVEYVKYLSIRGQYERLLISQLPGLEGEPLLEPTTVADIPDDPEDEESAEKLEEFQDRLFYVVYDNLIESGLLDLWLQSEDRVTDVAPAPPSLARGHPGHEELVLSGRALFAGKANCVQCHGETGVGDGQTENFDDWTKDWVAAQNIDPDDPATYREFTEAGALPPRRIRPRNLRVPVFRGGGSPDTLYRRIENGIEGTPMPSSAVLTPEEIWALVAYVQRMPWEPESAGKASPPVNSRPMN